MKQLLKNFLLILFFLLSLPPSAHPSTDPNTPPTSTDQKQTAPATPPGLTIDLQAYSYNRQEYQADSGENIYTKTERNWQLRTRLEFEASKYLSFSWQETAIEQKNEIFGDTDFAVESSGPIFGLGFPFINNGTVNAELRVEDYQDSSRDSFYQLSDSSFHRRSNNDFFYSGFIKTTFAGNNSWTTLSYTRSRDTEPVYDQVTGRAQLYIRAEEITGAATSWLINPDWKIGCSVFYEQYEAGTPDQFNLNGQIDYKPQGLKALHIALGSGYYTEERETIANLTADYLFSWRYAELSLQYQGEYSANEESLLHQGDALMTIYLNQRASFFFRGEYGEETGGDHDRFSSINAGIEYLF